MRPELRCLEETVLAATRGNEGAASSSSSSRPRTTPARPEVQPPKVPAPVSKTAGRRRRTKGNGSRPVAPQTSPGARARPEKNPAAAGTAKGNPGSGREPPPSSARSTEQERQKTKSGNSSQSKVVVPSRTGQKSPPPRSGTLVPGRPPGKKGAVGPRARDKKV